MAAIMPCSRLPKLYYIILFGVRDVLGRGGARVLVEIRTPVKGLFRWFLHQSTKLYNSQHWLWFLISLLTHRKLSNLISSGQEYAGKCAVIRGKGTDLQHLVIPEAQMLPPWPISSHQLVIPVYGCRFLGTTTWHQHSIPYLWALKAARAWCGGTP